MINLFNSKGSLSDHNEIESELIFGDFSKCPKPIISVIMPVYKRPEMLRIGLKTVLGQTVNVPFEVVIVDNNEEIISPNLSVVQEFKDDRVYYYRNKANLGMYGNFNRGISLSRGEYVTFCHDDDTLTEDSLQYLYDAKLRVQEECIIGEHNNINDEGTYIYKVNHYNSLLGIFNLKDMRKMSNIDLMIENPGIGGGGCLFDRKALMDMGGFNEKLYPGCDYGLILKYSVNYGVYKLLKSTYNYRIANNASFIEATKYPKINLTFHEMLLEFVKLPGIIKKLILISLYHEDCASQSKIWGVKSYSNVKFMFFYTVITKILRLYNRIRNYGIN